MEEEPLLVAVGSGGWAIPVNSRALLLAGLVALAAAALAPAAEAKTTVSIEGTVVTITVPLDFLGLPEDGGRVVLPDTGEGHNYAGWLEEQGEAIWNEAFAEHRYGDCLTFRLDVEIYPVSRADLRGHHGINFDPHIPDDAHVYDPATEDHNEDTSSAFTDSLTGDFGLIDGQTFAHELGHLMGLGDDYVRDENGNIDGVVKGRDEGTLMHGSETPEITQAIVDRIGKLVGEVHDLPECWRGTMEARGSYATTSPEGDLRCTYAWSADFRVVVDEAGSAGGDGSAAIDPGSSCISVLGQLGYPGKTPVSFEVSGRKDEDGFELTFVREQVPSFPYHILTVRPPTLTIPMRDPCTAEATVRQTTEDFKRQAGVQGPYWDVPSRTRVTLLCPSGEVER